MPRVVIAWPNRSLHPAGPDRPGLAYRRTRFYDASTGQFTQQDPIGLGGGANSYGFASGDPVSYSDPFGLCPKSGGGDGKTEGYADCPEGSSGYYANQDATGHGGVVNNLKGAVASCSESTLCKGTAIVGGIITGGIMVRAALASPLVAGVGSASVPILGSAQDKLAALEGQFGVASSNIVQMAMNGARYVDNANGGNINALLARPDGAAGFIRVTFDPNFQRVISAGLMRSNQVTNAIANGRFTPY